MILFAALTNVKLFKYLIKKASCISKRYFLFCAKCVTSMYTQDRNDSSMY